MNAAEVRQITKTFKQELSRAEKECWAEKERLDQLQEDGWNDKLNSYWSIKGEGWRRIQRDIKDASWKGLDFIKLDMSYGYYLDESKMRVLLPTKECIQRLEDDGFLVRDEHPGGGPHTFIIQW